MNETQSMQMQVANQIIAIAKATGAKFTLRGEEVAPNKIFIPTGLLPAIMRRADQLATFCFGYGLGVSFERADSATLGVTVNFDNQTPIALRMLCALDVIIEFVQAAPNINAVSLDDLLLD